MDIYWVHDKNGYFHFQMGYYSGTSFDNSEALGNRFSLVMIESGTGIAFIDGSAVPYIAPCAFCINEKEHFVVPHSDENRLRVIFIHPNVINDSLNFETVRKLPENCPVTLMQDRELLRLFLLRKDGFIGKFNLGPLSAKQFINLSDQFHELTSEQNQENWPCRSRSYLLWLLFLLDNLYSVGSYSSEQSLGEVEEKLNPILLYIYHNYDKKITVNDITSKFYISRTTLSKLFQDNIGDSFLSYLNKLRITMASTILRDTLLPVNEVMNRVGFSDTVHFFRTFKKYTGSSPSEYREKYGWM